MSLFFYLVLGHVLFILLAKKYGNTGKYVPIGWTIYLEDKIPVGRHIALPSRMHQYDAYYEGPKDYHTGLSLVWSLVLCLLLWPLLAFYYGLAWFAGFVFENFAKGGNNIKG